jgi:hypothetical protein
MTVSAPAVGSIVLYQPATSEQIGGSGNRAAVVIQAGGLAPAPDYFPSLFIHNLDGTIFVKSHVIHLDTWSTLSPAAQAATGCWSWPPAGTNS